MAALIAVVTIVPIAVMASVWYWTLATWVCLAIITRFMIKHTQTIENFFEHRFFR